MVIGVDFDNTIAIYDGLMHRIALEQGLIDSTVPKIKKQIRDTIRMLPDGEIEWQKLQGAVYGPRMHEARLAEGFGEFAETCARRGVPVHIISHKTEYANYDDTRSNLRTNARSWMEDRGFFQKDGIGLAENNLYFEPSRKEKLARIRQLGCTHFIDDLSETFVEEAFPEGVEKILYLPDGDGPDFDGPDHGLPSLTGLSVMNSWIAIGEHLFAAGR